MCQAHTRLRFGSAEWGRFTYVPRSNPALALPPALDREWRQGMLNTRTVNMMNTVTDKAVMLTTSQSDLSSLSNLPLSHRPLSYLTESKREQLQQAVNILLNVSSALRPSMILLVGSYARGDWLDTRKCQSSFDLLVVTKRDKVARKIQHQEALRKRWATEVETPVSLLAIEITCLNRRLRNGHYFYVERVQEGITLYNSGECQLEKPTPRIDLQRKALAKMDFTHWFSKAMAFKKGFNLYFRERDYNEAAFLLHQLVERLYTVVLLVLGRYNPNSHDLLKLGQTIASMEPRFLNVFPQSTPEEKARFELLRKAYVNARYRPNFHITQQELSWLAIRASYLQRLTEHTCRARIASY